MDANTVIASIETIVSNNLFPVLMCMALGWYIMKRDQSHKDELDSFAQAINNNTLVLQRILDRLER